MPFVVFVFSILGWIIFVMFFNFSLLLLSEIHRTFKPVIEQWNILKPMEIVENWNEIDWKEKAAKTAFLILMMFLLLGIVVSGFLWLILGWPRWQATIGFVFSLAIVFSFDPSFNPELTSMRRMALRAFAISLALFGFTAGFGSETPPDLVTLFIGAGIFAPFFWLVNIVLVYKNWHLPICSLFAIFSVAMCQIILLAATSTGETILRSVKYGGGVGVCVDYEQSGGAEVCSSIQGELILRSNDFLFVKSEDETHEIALDHVRVIDYPSSVAR